MISYSQGRNLVFKSGQEGNDQWRHQTLVPLPPSSFLTWFDDSGLGCVYKQKKVVILPLHPGCPPFAPLNLIWWAGATTGHSFESVCVEGGGKPSETLNLPVYHTVRRAKWQCHIRRSMGILAMLALNAETKQDRNVRKFLKTQSFPDCRKLHLKGFLSINFYISYLMVERSVYYVHYTMWKGALYKEKISGGAIPPAPRRVRPCPPPPPPIRAKYWSFGAKRTYSFSCIMRLCAKTFASKFLGPSQIWSLHRGTRGPFWVWFFFFTDTQKCGHRLIDDIIINTLHMYHFK